MAITDYISKRFNQEKVILVGHSFGTYIATLAAYKSPEKYEAYIGIGQMADTVQSENDILNYCIEQATFAENKEDMKVLNLLMQHIQNLLVPRSYVSKYGGSSHSKKQESYLDNFFIFPQYDIVDNIRRSRGIAVSQKKLLPEIFESPLPQTVKSLELPFYFIMGKYDYMTSTNAAKNYFDIIDTNNTKEFIPYENSAHYPQFEEKEKFQEWMFETFAK